MLGRSHLRSTSATWPTRQAITSLTGLCALLRRLESSPQQLAAWHSQKLAGQTTADKLAGHRLQPSPPEQPLQQQQGTSTQYEVGEAGGGAVMERNEQQQPTDEEEEEGALAASNQAAQRAVSGGGEGGGGGGVGRAVPFPLGRPAKLDPIPHSKPMFNQSSRSTSCRATDRAADRATTAALTLASMTTTQPVTAGGHKAQPQQLLSMMSQATPPASNAVSYASGGSTAQPDDGRAAECGSGLAQRPSYNSLPQLALGLEERWAAVRAGLGAVAVEDSGCGSGGGAGRSPREAAAAAGMLCELGGGRQAGSSSMKR